jgi:hypothetical protein
MSPGEIGRRLLRTFATYSQLTGFRAARHVPPPIIRSTKPWLLTDAVADLDSSRCAARRILDGELRVFACTVSETLAERNWNRDPSTGREAPLTFGKLIDYRDESIVGDIKYLWEKNRHLDLVTLALGYRASGSREFLDGLAGNLESWLDQCPYPQGVNWASSLEVAIRLINWSISWQLIGSEQSPAFDGPEGQQLRTRWLESIYQHVHFIANFYSQDSSANNHLIGESAGVFVACCTWPYWNKFASWRGAAREKLIQEAVKQTHADGVNKEQSTAYQHFVLDFLLLAGIAGKRSGDTFPSEYWSVVEKMLEFIAAIMDVAGNVPMIGDADDGFVTRLSHDADFRPFQSLLSTGALLFNRPDLIRKASALDAKTRFLVPADKWNDLKNQATPAQTLPEAFPHGGYYVLGRMLGTRDEVRMLVDAGPLGYLSIAAHGHADALSVVLSIAGEEILVDPGTYAYHTKARWREYFRSTGAHNTLRIDAEDQSVQGGTFMWLSHANSKVISHSHGPEDIHLVAEHDGYRRWSPPVTHRRSVHMRQTQIEITDTIMSGVARRVEQCWHFAENCEIAICSRTIRAKSGRVTVHMAMDEKVQKVMHFRGSADPIAGWISRDFDVKVPTSSLWCSVDIKGSCSLNTLIRWTIDPEPTACI